MFGFNLGKRRVCLCLSAAVVSGLVGCTSGNGPIDGIGGQSGGDGVPDICGKSELSTLVLADLSSSESVEGFRLRPQFVAELMGEHDVLAYRLSGESSVDNTTRESCNPGDTFDALNEPSSLALSYEGGEIKLIEGREKDGSIPSEKSECNLSLMTIPIRMRVELPDVIYEAFEAELLADFRPGRQANVISVSAGVFLDANDLQVDLPREDPSDVYDKIGRSETLKLDISLSAEADTEGRIERARMLAQWDTGLIGTEVDETEIPEELLGRGEASSYLVAEADLLLAEDEDYEPRCKSDSGIIVEP